MPARPSAPDVSSASRWWILIGHSNAFDSIDWDHYTRDTQMVILSDDPRIPLQSLPLHTLRLTYLSVGEADQQRPYWAAVHDRPFLVEGNPNWPGNVRVDIRDPQWQEVLITQEAPRLLRRGFQGFMLDTIDTVPYLETKDPSRFAGSRQALRDFLARMRREFPAIILLANGTDALVDVAPYVDGYVVEGVFATYDFGTKQYRATTDVERAWKLGQIDKAQSVAQRPVFTIEYAGPGDVGLGQWAAEESTKRGFRPYVTVKEINSLP
jgi:cysteinyl-tRNA synthetase